MSIETSGAWIRSILAVLVAAPLLGRPALGDAPAVKGEARPADATAGKASGKEPAKAPEAPLPDRPKKVVSPPSLEPAEVDSLLEKALAGTKAPVSPITTDEEFVRRIYLDVTGKLPTIDEMRAFVNARDKGKRARLIDALLKTENYAANWARYWRDVVAYRAPNTNVAQVNYPGFEAWLKGEIARNAPWDEVATAIITAKGLNTENGATSFGLAESAQPVEMAGEVSRIFLGVQIQCAQCHDHPNDPWKREQFHEFAAFFAGLKLRRVEKAGMGMPPVFELFSGPGVPRYTMPDLKDPSKPIPVAPKFFLAGSNGETAAPLTGLKSDQRRALAASYVTGQDNPWFARAFVNRVWGSLMGEGFYTPIDDLGPTKQPHDPEVLDALADAWQHGGYDVRWLFRTILNTKAYQRESRSTNSASGRTPFAANCASRLRADQIFDALSQALDLPAETFAVRPGRNMAPAQREEAAKRLAALPKGTQQVVLATIALRNGPRNRFNRTFGVDPSTPNDDVLGTIPQALFLMNSPAVNNGLKASGTSMLGELLRSTPDNRAVLEALYLRVLARRPNGKEVQVCGRYLEAVGNRVEAFEDILWGLVNSTEFISRR